MRVEHGQKLQGVRHDYYSMDLYLMLVLQNNNTAVEPIHMRTILNRIREDNIFLSGLTMGQETERNEAASNVAFSKLSEQPYHRKRVRSFRSFAVRRIVRPGSLFAR